MSVQTTHVVQLPAPCLSLSYLQYLPPEYEESDQKFPLVIFLHGSGERGDNLNLVKIHGWPRYQPPIAPRKELVRSDHVPGRSAESSDNHASGRSKPHIPDRTFQRRYRHLAVGILEQ